MSVSPSGLGRLLRRPDHVRQGELRGRDGLHRGERRGGGRTDQTAGLAPR